MVHPTYLVNVIKLKWEIIWTGGLLHQSGLPHLPGVPHLHVKKALGQKAIENFKIAFKTKKNNISIWHTFYSFFFLLDCKIVASNLFLVAEL